MIARKLYLSNATKLKNLLILFKIFKNSSLINKIMGQSILGESLCIHKRCLKTQ